MKKNRPGVLLQLLCNRGKLGTIREVLLKETTTLGIRYYPLTVFRAERTFRQVQTEWGPVTVKEGMYDGQVIQRAPEFEECKNIASTYKIPLKKVYEQVWKQLD